MCSLCSRLRRGVLYRVGERARRDQDRARPSSRRPPRDVLPEPVLRRQAEDDAAEARVRRRQARRDPAARLRARARSRALRRGAAPFRSFRARCAARRRTCSASRWRRMLREWEKRFPGRVESIFNALANVVPTHLLDRALHDFASVRATGAPDADGDLAFDADESLALRAEFRNAGDRAARRALNGPQAIHRRVAAIREMPTALWVRTLAILVVACWASFAAADVPAPSLAGPALRAALLRGGYVLYFRHGATDFGQNDERDDRLRGLRAAAQPHRPRPRRRACDRRRDRAAAHSGDERTGEPVLPHARNRRAHVRPRDHRCACARRTGAHRRRGALRARCARCCRRRSPRAATSRSSATATRSTRSPGRRILPKARWRSSSRSARRDFAIVGEDRARRLGRVASNGGSTEASQRTVCRPCPNRILRDSSSLTAGFTLTVLRDRVRALGRRTRGDRFLPALEVGKLVDVLPLALGVESTGSTRCRRSSSRRR